MKYQRPNAAGTAFDPHPADAAMRDYRDRSLCGTTAPHTPDPAAKNRSTETPSTETPSAPLQAPAAPRALPPILPALPGPLSGPVR